MIADKWLNAAKFTDYLRSLYMPGVFLQEFHRGRQQGTLLRIDPKASTDLTGLGVYMLGEINRASGFTFFRQTSRSKLNLFFKVYGSSAIRSQLEQGESPSSIVGSWKVNVLRFRKERAAYLIY
jgi:uncharacterized protein YbbC (DUF1343 family)